MQEIKDGLDFTKIIDKHDAVFIVLGADWCDNCTRLKHKLIQFNKPNIKLFYINLDKNDELVDQFDVKKIPVLLGFKEGVLTFTSHGSLVDVEQLINNF